MLDIVPSCNPVQYQEKLMIQTWENVEKSNFGSNFGPKNVLREFYLYYELDIVPSYHPMQFKRKLMKETWENDKNPILRLILVRLTQIWASNIFCEFYFY